MSYDFSFKVGTLMTLHDSPLPPLPKAVAAFTVSLAMGLILSAPASAQAPAAAPAAQTKPITVNGKTIPRTRLDFVLKQNVAQGQPNNEQVRQAIADRLVNTELLAQEADKRGLAKNGDGQIFLDLARQNALAQLVVEDYFKANPLKEEDVRAEYERIRSVQREYKAHHILVENEAEAKDIIVKLNAGGKFEELAKVSKDPGSKDKGGELDWAAPGNYVRPFSEALVKLEKGKITETPVRSDYGWHVIRLDDVRLPPQFPAYDQAKQQVVNVMRDRMIQTLVQDLRAKAKIE
jgi:peptidyl-prolyl cis-trans isomerase C